MAIIETVKNMFFDNIQYVGMYLLVIAAVIYIYYQIDLASKDTKSISRNFYYNLVVIVLPVILLMSTISMLSMEPSKQFYMLVICTIVGLFFFILFYFLKTKVSEYIFNSFILYTLVILIILIGLSIVFVIFSGSLRRLDGWVGFISNMIFFIPCLISDFVNYILKDFRETPASIVVLFLIELILIILYLYMVPFINRQLYPEKKYILDDSQFLNNEHIYPQATNPENKNFAISMWIYLNSMPHSKNSYSKETPIFFYGPKDESKQYIKIAYANNNLNSEEFIMYLHDNKFTITLPLQKWNQFVINYNTFSEEVDDVTYYKTVIDVFVNGVLERSTTIELGEEEPTTDISNDVIKTGTTDEKAFQNGGLYGAISNISYFTKPLTEVAIIQDYNFLSLKNPPLDDK